MSSGTHGPAAPGHPIGMLLAVLLAAVVLGHLPRLTDTPYGQHTWRMADTAAMARHFVDDGFDVLRPRIDWDRGQSGHVQTELPLYTWMVALLWSLGGEHVMTAQLLSLLLSIGAFGCFFGFARHVVGPSRALLATAILTFTPLVFYFSMSIQPEGLLLLATYGALFAWVTWLERRSLGSLLAWGAAMTVTMGIKPQNLLLLVPMFMLARTGSVHPPVRWRAPALVLALAFVIPAAWFWHGHAIYLATHNSFGITTSGGADKFSILLRLSQPEWYRVMIRDLLSYTWLPPALPFVAIGMVRAWREPSRRFLLVWTALVLLSFVLLAEAVWTMNYYQVPLAAPTALLAALGLSAVWDQIRRPVAMRGMGGVAVLISIAAIVVGLIGSYGGFDDGIHRQSGPGGLLGRALLAAGVQRDNLLPVALHASHSVFFSMVGWGVGLGLLMFAQWRRIGPPRPATAMRPLGALALALLAAWPMSAASGVRELWAPEYYPQYTAGVHLKALFPPRTLGVLGHQVYKRPHGYDPEPVIFFYSNMRGWIVPERDYRPSLLDSLVAQGARFFATTHLRELDRNPEFVEALARRGTLEERSLDYAIYRLNPPEGAAR
jgi:4-amino-4-deoxy-L-arabinose transferase-like glycosyltransferase